MYSGGTFGDVISSLSGMVVMSAGIAEVEHMDYVKAITPYNITAGILALLLLMGAGFIIRLS